MNDLLSNDISRISDDIECIELGESFDFDDFQVVRREFFAHLHEPSITFNNCKCAVQQDYAMQ